MYLGLFVFKMFVQLKPMLNVAVDGLVGAIIYIVLIIVLRVVDMKDLKQQLMKTKEKICTIILSLVLVCLEQSSHMKLQNVAKGKSD